MKQLISLFLILSLTAVLSTGCKTKTNHAVTLYPVPDLSEITGLEESNVFSLSLDKEKAFVYRSFETRDSFEWYGDAGVMVNSPSYHGVSFCNFTLNRATKALVQSGKKMLEWSVKPSIEGVKEIDDQTLHIPINGFKKFVVSALFEGDEEWSYFIISAEKAETLIPDKQDTSVLFLEAGTYHFGQAWDPFVDGIKTLYLSPGAIVEATIKTRNKADISIIGRGIFAQAFVKHAEEVEHRQEQEWDADWMGINISRSKNIIVDGITVMNSPSFQLEFAMCDSVQVNNVKLCGFGEHNNDGLHTYGYNIYVEDCFIACNDDRICITGLFDDDEGNGNLEYDGSVKLSGASGGNLHYKNIVMLGLHNNGGDFMLTWNGEGSCDNVHIENCYSLAPTNKGFIASKHGGSCVFSNIVVENCELYHANLLSLEVKDSEYQGAGGGVIKDVHLKNIRVNAKKNEIARHLLGHSTESNIELVVLENIMASDGKLTHIDETAIEINKFIDKVVVK